MYSRPGESEREFRIRLAQAARERRDQEVDKLRKRYRPKFDRLRTRLQREKIELAEDQAEYAARKQEEMVSGAETLLGILGIFGRRKSISSAMTKRRMTAKAKMDVDESIEEIARLEKALQTLEEELRVEAEAIATKWEETQDDIEPYLVKPRRMDVSIDLAALAWIPYWEIVYEARGQAISDRIPAWKRD